MERQGPVGEGQALMDGIRDRPGIFFIFCICSPAPVPDMLEANRYTFSKYLYQYRKRSSGV
jgi:hypothetical protein